MTAELDAARFAGTLWAAIRTDGGTRTLSRQHRHFAGIDAGVFAMAAGITGGQLNLVGASLDHFGVVRWKLEQMGVEFGTNGAVVVHGPCTFKGAEVVAHDLRTGIALVLAGPAAEGETLVTPGYPIDRGHASIAQRFKALGADVTAVPA